MDRIQEKLRKNPEENEKSCQENILHSLAKAKLREKKNERKFSNQTVHDIFIGFYILQKIQQVEQLF